jgi:glycosyltransferase involved in cell wall biosynthesis
MRVLVYSAQMEAIGGIESHVVEFCVRLAHCGHRITLMSSRFELSADSIQLLHAAGIELFVNRRHWSSRTALRKWIWTLLTLLRLAGRNFDVVYTNGQGRNPAAVHAWFRGRVRLVHHHHTSCDRQDVATWPNDYVVAMQRADVLVVCAEFIRGRMQAATGRPDVSVVYCFSREAQRVPTAPPLEDQRVVFGYFGRLIREKGIDWILRLSSDPRLRAITWRIWGLEGAYRRDDFTPYTNVEYRGAFSTEEGLWGALDALHCFCLFSSHPEGVPVSLIEAMSAGKPWISTAQGGIPELAHDPGSCAIVSLDDYDGVVNACLAMSRRIQAAQFDREGQRAFYRSRFGKEALLPKWTTLLSGVT